MHTNFKSGYLFMAVYFIIADSAGIPSNGLGQCRFVNLTMKISKSNPVPLRTNEKIGTG